MKTNRVILCAVFVLSCLAVGAYAEGLVSPGTTELNDSGTSSNPAEWYLDDDYVIGDTFYVGRSTASVLNRNWNQFSISDGYDFTANAGLVIGEGYQIRNGNSDYNSITVNEDSVLTSVGNLIIGGPNGQRNYLTVLAGAEVNVAGNIKLGGGSTSYYGRYNHVDISGSGARLSITGSLDANNGYNGTENTVNVSDDGVMFIDSNKDGTGILDLYYHSSYGRCYLELDGGLVALWGDETGTFAPGQTIRKCIKLWDEESSSWKIVADLPSGSTLALGVDYVVDAAKAAELGLDDEFIGFTVLQSVPEPASVMFLVTGSVALCGRKIRRKR
ncbi:MAG: hypothetical protein JW849_09890 [Phycisphaerae bacterium]|nr:hypothetical protein [Phycisphaerae bacterium]